MMNYQNSIVYVQRQIDRLLRAFRVFARVYVDDIVIVFATLEKHMKHLTQVFQVLMKNNIFIKLIKIFIEYSIVQLLDQRINFFELSTTKKKLRAIALIKFFTTLDLLKIYLDLTSWLRDYVFFYVEFFKLLQKRKTKLLRRDLVVERERKFFAIKTKLRDIIELKKTFFATL